MLRRTPLRRKTPLRSRVLLVRQQLAAGWQKRHRDTGPDTATRIRVVLRSDGVCERCGKDDGQQVHHRRPRRAGGSKAPDTNGLPNLGHLCVGCHGWVESNRAAALCEGWLLHANENPATVPVLTRHGLVRFNDNGGWELA